MPFSTPVTAEMVANATIMTTSTTWVYTLLGMPNI